MLALQTYDKKELETETVMLEIAFFSIAYTILMCKIAVSKILSKYGVHSL